MSAGQAASASVAALSEGLGWINWANLVGYLVNSGITYASIFGAFGPDNSELSEKYQLLITPAGFAFAIWGPIFIWEGVFAVAQMLPRFRGTLLVKLVTPGWLAACGCQCLWTVFFAQEWLPVALVCMLGILGGLLAIAKGTDGLPIAWPEFLLLRGGFSLHLGWIIAATTLNVSVVADGARASPGTLLGLAITSIGAVCVLACGFAFVARRADPIVCLVAAWAFNGIRVKLSDPRELDSRTRFNPYTWDRVTLEGLQLATGLLAILALLLAAAAAVRLVQSSRSAATAVVVVKKGGEEEVAAGQATAVGPAGDAAAEAAAGGAREGQDDMALDLEQVVVAEV